MTIFILANMAFCISVLSQPDPPGDPGVPGGAVPIGGIEILFIVGGALGAGFILKNNVKKKK